MITVTGSGGGNSHITQFTLVVNAPSSFDFSLSNSGGITVTQGSSGSNTITASLLSGSTQPVTLSCTSGLPSGASCSFNPSSDSPTFSSTLTISTTSSTPTGSYPITVNGSPSALAPTQFTLTVNPPSMPSSTSVSCSQSSVQASGSTQCTATVTGSGPTPTGSVTWFESVSGGSFSPETCSLASGSCTVTYNAPPTQGPVTITAQYYGDTNYQQSTGTATLTITGTPPSHLTSIQISANPLTVTQTTGLSGSTITTTALDQNLSPMPNVPISLTATSPGVLSPQTVTTGSNGQATSTLTVSESVTTSVTVSVQASSGSVQSQTIQVTFQPPTSPAVKFSATGLGSSASGAALIVDGTTYSVSQLPMQFSWTPGSSHSFSWYSEILAGSTEEDVWQTTSGLSTQQSGTIDVPSGGGNVIATYQPYYYVTFVVNPSGAGTITPSGGGEAGIGPTSTSERVLYYQGAVISIKAQAGTGNSFQSWTSSTSSISISGSTAASTSATINGPGTITANFGVSSTYAVMFSETGLSISNPGLVWSVTFNGQTESSDSGGNTISGILFTGVPPGSYGFTVTPPPGYSASPQSSQVNVNSSTCTANYIDGIPAACVETISFTPSPTASISNSGFDNYGSLAIPANTSLIWVSLIPSIANSVNKYYVKLFDSFQTVLSR